MSGVAPGGTKYRFHSKIGDVFYWDSNHRSVIKHFYFKTEHPSFRLVLQRAPVGRHSYRP